MNAVKCNLKALAIHILFSVVGVIVWFIFDGTSYKWASEKAEQNHQNLIMMMGVVVIIIAIIFYFICARIYLINQGSLLKNMFAASLPFIIGILIWISAAILRFYGLYGDLLGSDIWGLYGIYNGYSFLFLNAFDINNVFLFLIPCFIPSIAMALGMQSRSR